MVSPRFKHTLLLFILMMWTACSRGPVPAIEVQALESLNEARKAQEKTRLDAEKRVRFRRPGDVLDKDIWERATRGGIEGDGLDITACPRIKSTPRVYAVGSSTMAGLGYVMRHQLRNWGIHFETGAKPSTGLARPDFYDWPAQIPAINKKWDPDVYVVALGTNDCQAMRTRKRTWIRPNLSEWAMLYGKRIDLMLSLMNKDRPRTVIWIGPSALPDMARRRLAKRISAIMKKHVEAFDGDTMYIDLYATVSRTRMKRHRKFRRPTDGHRKKIWAGDGIHLSGIALRWLLAERIYQRLRPCWVNIKPGDPLRRARGEANRHLRAGIDNATKKRP